MAEIWSYLAKEASEAVATRFVNKIHETCAKLLTFPLAYPARPQLGDNLRVTFHGAYAIYYRPGDESVIIIRVLHGARDVWAIADEGGFLCAPELTPPPAPSR